MYGRGGRGCDEPLRQTTCLTKHLTPTEANARCSYLSTVQQLRVGGQADTGLAGLKCTDPDNHLAASNPTRTATEHFDPSAARSLFAASQRRMHRSCIEPLQRAALEALGLEDSYPMDLEGEVGVGESWGASSSVSQQSMDCYIEPPASVKNKKVAKHISLAECCKFLLWHQLFS
eukprot:365504-Chlamydomonas_euryale.AAC.3